jgi:phosphinothricin acetyltransferase
MTVKIRVAMPVDGETVAAIYAPIVQDTAISFETVAPSAEAMAGRISRTLTTHPWLVAERDGQVIGFAYAGLHRERAAYRWSADATVYVGAQARGGGVGRALYTPLFRILRAQNYRSVYAAVVLPNEASIGLHEAMGFTPLGVYRNVGFKHGQWRDIGYWQLDLSGTSDAPQEPVPFAGGAAFLFD